MRNILIFLLCLGPLSSCSTVEARKYYTPQVDQANAVGPDGPYCGWLNFGGEPDRYVLKKGAIGISEVYVTARQDYHPYLFGPWFASIVPVFPIIWVAELIDQDDLKVVIVMSSESGDSGESQALLKETIFSVSNTGKGREALPASETIISDAIGYGAYADVTFPIDADKVKSFVLEIENANGVLEIPFTEATRWSWTQWTPNC